ncbi:RNA polymerase sigma factor [Alteribacter keqinensis]|uniref:RNA polymerase sigma factor n=1 Tax=Alteribacter keqinensis TaxID=2483800 RepID=A0A3M7TSP8_9BACI|nr:RNA polymerase sigma factor [Alteribacter keqinensis]RNA68660.1 RNA polymerase sigma factor [Alteribacter keqinensis]
MENHEEKRWIHQSLNGDDEAFYELIVHYQPVVEKFARQIGVSESDLPDITQEVFIKVYRFLDTYSRGKFSTWLYSITLNVCRDVFRKNKRDRMKLKKYEKEITSFYPQGMSDYAAALNECLSRLEEKYRVPLVLYYFHDRPLSEISLIMEMKENSVKTRLKRGKEKLKAAMKKGGFTDE